MLALSRAANRISELFWSKEVRSPVRKRNQILQQAIFESLEPRVLFSMWRVIVSSGGSYAPYVATAGSDTGGAYANGWVSASDEDEAVRSAIGGDIGVTYSGSSILVDGAYDSRLSVDGSSLNFNNDFTYYTPYECDDCHCGGDVEYGGTEDCDCGGYFTYVADEGYFNITAANYLSSMTAGGVTTTDETARDLYLAANSSGSASFTPTATFGGFGNTSDFTWHLTTSDSNGVTAADGNFGSTITVTPGSNGEYVLRSDADGTYEREIDIHVARLTSLQVADTHSGGPSVTTSNSTVPDLYIEKPDSGAATIKITPGAVGTVNNTVKWAITGSTASPNGGDFGGSTYATATVDGGSYTYGVMVFADVNGNGAADTGEAKYQANVHVVKPDFMIYDHTSTNEEHDLTDNVSTPTDYLGVTKDSSGGPQLTLSMLDSLSGALPGGYTVTISSSSTTIYSGSFNASGTDLSSGISTSGAYSAVITRSSDTNFNRTIKFYVADLKILWKDAAITGVDGGGSGTSTLFANGDNISEEEGINYLAGQRIILGWDSNLTLTQTVWTLDSGAIKNYSASNSSASVAQLTTGDLAPDPIVGGAHSTITFYPTVDGAQTYWLTAYAAISGTTVRFDTWTTFNILKPGQSIFNTGGRFQVTGQQTDAEFLASPAQVQDEFSWSTATGGAPGTISFVQLIDSTRLWKDSLGFIHTTWDTGGAYWLDTVYPYATPGLVSTSDTPYQSTGVLVVEAQVTDAFKGWLLWTSSRSGSMPVPIQTWSWGWTADYLAAGGSVATPSGTVGGLSYVYGSDTDLYPIWDHRLFV